MVRAINFNIKCKSKSDHFILTIKNEILVRKQYSNRLCDIQYRILNDLLQLNIY